MVSPVSAMARPPETEAPLSEISDGSRSASKAPVCLVALTGLPGAGKTTLACSLCRHLEKAQSEEVEAHHICFDEFTRKSVTPPGEPSQGANQSERSFSEDSRSSSFSFDPLAWKTGRQEALRQVESLLANHGPPAERWQRRLVLADDTCHLRSMRYALFQMARKYGAAFVIIYVHVAPSVAWDRNDGRRGEEKVPRRVWERLAAAVDTPDPATNSWENPTVTVKPANGAAAEDLGKQVWQDLEQVWGPPVPPLPSLLLLAALREEGQQGNRRSLVHRVDMWSRGLLSQVLAAPPTPTSGPHPKPGWLTRAEAAHVLTPARREMLQRVQQLSQGRWLAAQAVTLSDTIPVAGQTRAPLGPLPGVSLSLPRSVALPHSSEVAPPTKSKGAELQIAQRQLAEGARLTEESFTVSGIAQSVGDSALAACSSWALALAGYGDRGKRGPSDGAPRAGCDLEEQEGSLACARACAGESQINGVMATDSIGGDMGDCSPQGECVGCMDIEAAGMSHPRTSSSNRGRLSHSDVPLVVYSSDGEELAEDTTCLLSASKACFGELDIRSDQEKALRAVEKEMERFVSLCRHVSQSSGTELTLKSRESLLPG